MVTTRRGKTATAAGAAEAAGGAESAAKPALRVLKKYPNRRLYDTQTSSYITLADVKKMVLAGQSFEVRDAKTGEELTRAILLQIILEEETGGVPMFSTQALEQIIRFYGHSMQGVMGGVLDKNMQMFTDMQASFAEQSKGAFSPEAWSKFLGAQSPMPGLMGGAIPTMPGLGDMGTMVEQFTEQMAKVFPGMPGMPGFPPKKS